MTIAADLPRAFALAYDSHENEHQELFHLGVDLSGPIPLHIPSPLGKLGYFIYARVPADAADKLSAVTIKIDLVGLVSTNTEIKAGDGAPPVATIPSRQKGLVWRCLGKAMAARGDGTLEMRNWPADLKKVDLVLCTWPRFLESLQVEDWIELQADPLFAPTGVPLGGIGGGRIDICKDGRFRNFSMNNNQDAPLEDPNGLAGAYLAVSSDNQTKDLASRPILPGHKTVDTLAFSPRFPQATLKATAAFPGLDITVTLSGTLCPHDLKRSSLPGLLVRWEISNTSRSDRTIRCHFGWPN
ncbi:MAG TPA: GH116 family glycosyl-hydrolase, partial [Tepidisphaeraceae bacterium]